MILSGPTRMDQKTQARAPTTCRLTLEGGSNKTEMAAYRTSIARAELVCTGRVIRVAVHPVLAPFVQQFKGVSVAPSMRTVALEPAAAAEKQEDCVSRSDTLLYLCNGTTVFLRPRIVNLESTVEAGISNEGARQSAPGFFYVISYENNAVAFLEPFISRVQMHAVMLNGFNGSLYMQGWLVNETFGLVGGGMMVFEGTSFTHNKGLIFGGAVSLMAGYAVFVGCVFNGNWAKSLNDITGGVASVDILRFGLGGAVLAYQLARGNLTVQTSATFVSCVFRDNAAYEGGAIAVVGVRTSVTNCSFEGNRASQNGFDVFASRGGSLNITDSNITATSPTVLWERVNVS